VVMGSQSTVLIPARPILSKGIGLPCAEHFPGGFGTTGKCCLCASRSPYVVCRPEHVLEDQPAENFAFVFYFGRPYLLPVVIGKEASELNVVGRTCGVLAISCEPPDNIVGLVCQCNVVYHVPQLYKLQYLLPRRNSLHTPHPDTSLYTLRHHQALSPCKPEHYPCNFLRCLAMELGVSAKTWPPCHCLDDTSAMSSQLLFFYNLVPFYLITN
jgi:hypothetical protein